MQPYLLWIDHDNQHDIDQHDDNDHGLPKRELPLSLEHLQRIVGSGFRLRRRSML